MMIIKAGLRGVKLMLLPMRACVSFGLTPTWAIVVALSGNTLTGFNIRKDQYCTFSLPGTKVITIHLL